MADPFVAEIRIFPFNFAPKGWAFCNGQLIPLSQNTALFSLLGTIYGGDGLSTFALPDLQGRAPMFYGQGPGLSPRAIGEQGGSATVTLAETGMPAHTHALAADASPAATSQPAGNLPAMPVQDAYATQGTAAGMSANALLAAGGGQPHNNMQPYLTFYFCIALQGVFPSRS
jgi:microcystin-dependent protein